jgi:exoribonuclease-2
VRDDAAWLAGEVPAPERVKAISGLDGQLRLQDQVAQRLKARRHQQGALSLETIEPRAVFEGEVLTDLRVEKKNHAKELIEDFMIAANQATAPEGTWTAIPKSDRTISSSTCKPFGGNNESNKYRPVCPLYSLGDGARGSAAAD